MATYGSSWFDGADQMSCTWVSPGWMDVPGGAVLSKGSQCKVHAGWAMGTFVCPARQHPPPAAAAAAATAIAASAVAV